MCQMKDLPGTCWPDGGISWLVNQKRDDRTPPQTRVNGVGREQQQAHIVTCGTCWCERWWSYVLWVFFFRGELGFLDCDDICMCIVNKHFEFLEFVSNSFYVGLK